MLVESVALVSPKRVERFIEDAFVGRRPFSLVRCGDGEAAILGFPEYMHEVRFKIWMDNFFGGASAGDYPDAPRLRAGIETAVREADVVGTFRERLVDVEDARARLKALGQDPRPAQADRETLSHLEWRLVNRLIEPLLRPDSVVTNTGIHIALERTGYLSSLIERSTEVHFITGNRLGEVMAQRFGEDRIHIHPVPTEHKFRKTPNSLPASEPHMPVVFDRLLEAIQAGNFGGTTLIGAGPCGKVYAAAIRRAGGFALDIGSIMDLWAGRRTRSYMPAVSPPA